LSKKTAEMVHRQGETVLGIEENVNSAGDNLNKAVNEIRQANQANKTGGGMLNKAIYIVLAIVVLLIILSWMMPK
jgi:t-SNARE complex subunit (syntaxin)